MKKKVTYVLWKAAWGGIEVTVADYCKLLHSDYNLEIYSLRPSHAKNSFFSDLPIVINEGSSYNFLLYIKFLQYVINNRNNIFHLLNSGPVILFLLRVIRIKKIIYHIHGTKYWGNLRQKLLLRMFWKLAITTNITFLANSLHSKKIFFENVRNNVDIEVIYNPFDIERFKPTKSRNDLILRVAYIGRLVEGKNLYLWIDVAHSLLKKYPHIQFQLVGSGPLKFKLMQEIKQKGLEDKITFVGFVKNINKVYQSIDLVLFLSKYESFGNVIVESLLTATPIIASNIQPIREILRNYPYFLVDLNNEIVNQISEKIDNISTLNVMASQASEEFRNKYNLDNHIERLRKIYAYR